MFEEYSLWSNDQNVKFLAYLSHELTVCARGTYEVGTRGVLQPALLRAYNELQHRVTASVRDHLLEKAGMPQSAVLEMLNTFAGDHGCKDVIDDAIQRARQLTIRTCSSARKTDPGSQE
jgi:hypothetical protein